MASGVKLDAANKCKAPARQAGCTALDCGDDEMAYAKDLSGAFWIFSSACYPAGWEEIESMTLPEGASTWPACP